MVQPLHSIINWDTFEVYCKYEKTYKCTIEENVKFYTEDCDAFFLKNSGSAIVEINGIIIIKPGECFYGSPLFGYVHNIILNIKFITPGEKILFSSISFGHLDNQIKMIENLLNEINSLHYGPAITISA